MIDALRPSTLGEILDRTANVYRTRFLVFLGIAIMPASVILACIAASVLFFIWMGTQGNAAGPALVGVASLVFLAVGGLIFLPVCAGAAGLGSGALSHAAMACFENREITIGDAYRAAWKHGWRYIGLLVLEGLIIVAVPAVLWVGLVVIFAVGQVAGGTSTAPMSVGITAAVLLFLAAMGLYALGMLLMLCLSFPVCVVENVGAWTAVKRAIALSKGTRGRILVLYILVMLLRWGISLVLTIPAILIVTLIPGIDTPQHAQVIGSVMAVVIYGGSFLVRGITKPIYAIAHMTFYYDQRIRKEGFDIEWLMRQAGMVQAPPELPKAAPWMAAMRTNDGTPMAVQQTIDPAVEKVEMTPQASAMGDAADPGQMGRQENGPALQSLPGEPACMSEAMSPGPPYPGLIPLTTGRALDRIFRLFRAHLLLFLRIASVPAAGILVVQAVVWVGLIAAGVFRNPHQPPDVFRMVAVLLPVGFIAGLAFGLAYAIFEAAATYAGLRASLGVHTSMRAAYRAGFNHAGRYLWLMILRQVWIGLPIWACFAVIAGVMFTFSSKEAGTHPGIYFAAFPLLTLMYLGAIVYAFIMWIRLSLAVPASVAENATASAALRRSLALTKDAKGRIFVVMLAIYAAAYAAIMAFEIVVAALGGGGVLLFSLLNVHPSTGLIVTGVVVLAVFFAAALFLWMAALSAGYAISFVVLYQDQRLRIEGIPPLAAGEPA